MQINILVIT